MTRVLAVPPLEEWTCQWTCGGCGARLESNGDDVHVGEFSAMGDYTSIFYVACPRCGRCKTWKLYTSEIPAHVQHEARKRAS